MENDIKNKIKTYCEKINMKMDKVSINVTEEGYVATDGYTSIMFDKNGKASSLPMYKLYGSKTTQMFSKLSILYFIPCIILLLIIGYIFLIK